MISILVTALKQEKSFTVPGVIEPLAIISCGNKSKNLKTTSKNITTSKKAP